MKTIRTDADDSKRDCLDWVQSKGQIENPRSGNSRPSGFWPEESLEAMNAGRIRTILLAEHDQHDAFMMEMACQHTGVVHRFELVPDGETAIDYLSGNGEFADRAAHPLPDLMLIDSAMPNGDGLDVLEWMRARPQFETQPVIMLTDAHEATDMHRAYGLGVTSCVTKRAKPADLANGLEIILKYWLEMKD